jgi:uncharacterized phage-associated protein
MESIKYFPSHIANFFLWLSKKQKGKYSMTNMQLIKLTYFAYAWYYALYKERLFAETPEAWDYGPVIPSIYHEFKRFGKSPIDTFAVEEISPFSDDTYHPIVDANDDRAISVINAVWDAYKDNDGDYLSNLTHRPNSPWKNVFEKGKNNPLKIEDVEKVALEAIEKYKTLKEKK